MSKEKMLIYLIITIVVGAIGYYFANVHKPADYQHPRVRSGAVYIER
ncbi:MAG: hypothetical protein LBU73_06035 [Helicobacteraceae bacterium]|jgi:hypothetical protein|nr:hypothetical protein [Helicobacteraceae bacterium]